MIRLHLRLRGHSGDIVLSPAHLAWHTIFVMQVDTSSHSRAICSDALGRLRLREKSPSFPQWTRAQAASGMLLWD